MASVGCLDSSACLSTFGLVGIGFAALSLHCLVDKASAGSSNSWRVGK